MPSLIYDEEFQDYLHLRRRMGGKHPPAFGYVWRRPPKQEIVEQECEMQPLTDDKFFVYTLVIGVFIVLIFVGIGVFNVPKNTTIPTHKQAVTLPAQEDAATEQEATETLDRLRQQQTQREIQQTVAYLHLLSYRDTVQEKVRDIWYVPLASGGLQARVLITSDRIGYIEHFRFLQRSGNRLFDESVQRAIKQAEPLEPLPTDYIGRALEIEMRFRSLP